MISTTRTGTLILLLHLSLFASWQASAQAQVSTNAPTAQPALDATPEQLQSMLLGPGDVISVNISNSAEFASKARIDASGDVSLPYFGVQHIGGKTVEQMEELLAAAAKTKGYFVDPQVTVSVDEFHSQVIAVTGEVNKPGVFPGLGHQTLYQALANAGGLTQLSGNTILIYRRGSPLPIRVALDADPGHLQDTSKIPVYAGDTINVPKTGVVYVVGALKQPNAFPVPNNGQLTLVQAVTLAGGPLRTAQRGHIHVVRLNGTNRIDLPVDFGKVLAGKQEDISIQANDIVYVPDSYTKIIAAGSTSVIGSAIVAAAYLAR